jgi:hypothetical protein
MKKMSPQIPNFEWYSSQSRIWKLTPRCPIASSELCPRYYDSLYLLADMKVVTPISEEDKTRLNNKWKPFAFTIDEESPTAFGDGREYSYRT